MESVIKQALERSREKQLTFEKFFKLADELKSSRIYHVASLESSELLYLYIPGNAT